MKEKLLTEVVHKYAFEDFHGVYVAFDKARLGYQEGDIASHKDMEAYYSEEEIARYGVVAIELKLLQDPGQVRAEK